MKTSTEFETLHSIHRVLLLFLEVWCLKLISKQKSVLSKKELVV